MPFEKNGVGGSDPSVGKNTRFSSTYQPVNRRPPSIKGAIKKVLGLNGVMKVPRSQVLSITDEYVEIQIPKDEAVALKILSWVMSKKGNQSLKASQMLIDQLDGKAPVSQVNIQTNNNGDGNTEQVINII